MIIFTLKRCQFYQWGYCSGIPGSSVVKILRSSTQTSVIYPSMENGVWGHSIFTRVESESATLVQRCERHDMSDLRETDRYLEILLQPWKFPGSSVLCGASNTYNIQNLGSRARAVDAEACHSALHFYFAGNPTIRPRKIRLRFK